MEVKFKLFPTKQKSHTISHSCKDMNQALDELYGMWYALRLSYKTPKLELWYNGTLMKRIS